MAEPTADQIKQIDDYIQSVDIIVRDMTDSTDNTKVRQFQYKSKILEKNYTDFDQAEHRIKIPLESGLAWFIIDKIADDTVLDGWELVYDKSREYSNAERKTIHEIEVQIRSTLNNIQGDDEKTIQSQLVSIRRRDGWGAMLPIFGNTPNLDCFLEKTVEEAGEQPRTIYISPFLLSQDELKQMKRTLTTDQQSQLTTLLAQTAKDLKRIQVFPPNMIRISDSNLDSLGYPRSVNLVIAMSNGGRKEIKLDVEADHVILFKGKHIDGRGQWIGQSVLQPNLAYIIMLEWTAYSGADFANNRGSFLWLKRALPATTSDKLQLLHEKLMYIFTRNALVTGNDVEVTQMAAGGTAVPIGDIMDRIYQLLATGTAIPESKLKGAPHGAISASKEDRIEYYPVLRAEQKFLVPLWKKLMNLVAPGFLEQYGLDIAFKIEINLSAEELENLRSRKLSNIKSQLDILERLKFKVGEAINIIEAPEFIPQLEEGDERLELPLSKAADFQITAPDLPAQLKEGLEGVSTQEALQKASATQIYAALLRKPTATIDELCLTLRTTKEKLSEQIMALKEKLQG